MRNRAAPGMPVWNVTGSQPLHSPSASSTELPEKSIFATPFSGSRTTLTVTFIGSALSGSRKMLCGPGSSARPWWPNIERCTNRPPPTRFPRSATSGANKVNSP